ncbi:MAG: GntR family transcriptional regulator [Acidimicrobiia bacterium]
MRWLQIAEDLRARLGSGELAAGRVLPSEADLSAAYDASRVTVRKALESLREDGLVDARQGFGWFVATDPLRQVLGRLSTIESQLADSGVVPERRVLDFEFVEAPPDVAAVLGAGTVLRVRRLNLADGEPFARVTVWCPERYGSSLSRDEVARSPFYELLSVELGGAVQTIGADAASAVDAAALAIPVGSPVLVCRRVTSSVGGGAVLLSEHVFPAHRTEFVVALPRAERSMAPGGLRLVGGAAGAPTVPDGA